MSSTSCIWIILGWGVVLTTSKFTPPDTSGPLSLSRKETKVVKKQNQSTGKESAQLWCFGLLGRAHFSAFNMNTTSLLHYPGSLQRRSHTTSGIKYWVSAIHFYFVYTLIFFYSAAHFIFWSLCYYGNRCSIGLHTAWWHLRAKKN